MRTGAPICVGTAILLFGSSANADHVPPTPDLARLLSIGASKPRTDLRWGMGRAQLHALYPTLSPTTVAVGVYSIKGAARYRGCTFALRLDNSVKPKPDGTLRSATLQYETGTLPTCRQGLETALSALYGDPHITKHPAGWPDGSGPPATVIMDWTTATTCARLWWEDGEAQWAPSLRLILFEKDDGCGGYDDQVVTPTG